MDLLVIGWDAATDEHLSELNLPFWESLPEGGLLLPEPPFDKAGYISSANAWTTMTTGAGFADHDILGFVFGPYAGHPLSGAVKRVAAQQWLPTLLRRVLIGRVLGTLGAGSKGSIGDKVDSTNVQYKRVWEYLDGDALIYGLPLTYPTWPTNGVLVSGIPAPRPEEASNPVVYPETLEDYVYENGDVGYYVDAKSPVNDSDVSETRYCEEYRQCMRANAEKFIDLYENDKTDYDFEFGFLMLRALDSIMHATNNRQHIFESYEAIDAATQRVVNAIDPDAVLILSDHGMRPVSLLRNNMRMDHDTTQGVWRGSEAFGLHRHTDVTPAILDYFDVDETFPKKRDQYDVVTSDSDRKAIHERLEDLGYA